MATIAVLQALTPLVIREDNSSHTEGMDGTSLHSSPKSLQVVRPSTIVAALLSVYALWTFATLFYNAYLHPLRKFPGPLAARSSEWWKVYIEVWKKESMTEVLKGLHEHYGDVVRTAPNELHFANPTAYHEIYAPALRWDKERTLYHSMGVDRTSFGYLTYPLAKQRKDVLQPLFSRRHVSTIQGLVKQKLDVFCEALAQNNEASQSSNLYLGIRCLTVDTISAFCFGKSLNALTTPEFRAPIVMAMDCANPEFLPFKHLPTYRNLIFSLPPSIAGLVVPDTSGFAQISNLTRPQVDAAFEDPSSLQKYPHQTIYHRLLDPVALDGQPIPSKEMLLQEAKNLIFAGTDTLANTLYVGFWQLISRPEIQQRLREEIKTLWPVLSDDPTYEALNALPFLTAVIKESLRLSTGVASALPRVVPEHGATINSHKVPGGTTVGMSAVFMHYNPDIFANPHIFDPERWLSRQSKDLERYLVAFSRGPRSCLGINLAWCELYLSFATLVRKFEFQLDEEVKQELNVDEYGNLMWKDTFLPWFYGTQMKGFCRPLTS